MAARLLLIGGGHAHLPLIRAIPKIIAHGHEVVVVSASPVHYYSGMGPGMLGGTYRPEEIRFPIQQIVESAGGRFIEGRAVRVDALCRSVELRSGASLSYDVLSLNTGSTIARTVAVEKEVEKTGSPKVFYVKPIEGMLGARERVIATLQSGPIRIAVVGGGPAAVESAGSFARIIRHSSEPAAGRSNVCLITGRHLLPGFSLRSERLARAALEGLGVVVTSGAHAESVTADGIRLADGSQARADLVMVATGVVPSRLIADSGLPTGRDGSMAVNEHLQALGHPEIFGGGDCIWFTPHPLARAGVYAVRQAPVLVRNILARLQHGGKARLSRFRPGGSYLLLLNLGNETAVFWRRILGFPLAFSGRLAYRLKDKIDTAFMRRYGSEATGERHEYKN